MELRGQPGFTLIEMLIVLIILGILAMIFVPQISVSTDHVKLNTLKTTLSALRKAVERYYHQHGNTYPGANDDKGSPTSDQAKAEQGFLGQLTRYTDDRGFVYPMREGMFGETYEFGPYLKNNELPLNPFNNDNDILCDITTTDITSKASDGSSGWKFYVKTGVLMANDGVHNDL